MGRTTQFAYNARNQLTSLTGPDPDGPGPQTAPVTTYTFDAAGNQTGVTDPLGRTSTTSFDAQGRVVAQTLPDPDGAGPLTAPLTQFTYDLAGRQSAIIDPIGNQTQYAYDNAGRLASVTDPLSQVTQYQYDVAGQFTAITDRNGRTRTFTYNDLGLATTENWLDAQQQPIRTISWTYDDAGQMLSASDPDSSYAYTYDLAGQVLHITNQGTPGLPLVELNSYYDFAGNRTSTWDNLGGSVGYVYENHRLSQLSMSVTEGPTAQVDFAYDTVGRLTSVVRTANTQPDPSLQTAYAYDDGDRLTSITHDSIVDQVPITLSQFSYTFDAANQITSYTGPEGTLNYAYDQTGQLISVSGARTENYSFDVNGNRTMPGYQTGAGNRLLTDGVYNYTYDNEGNLLTKTRISDGQVTENTWDYRNRLTRIVVKDTQGIIIKEARYTYDVDDRRIGVWEDADGAGAGEPTQRWTAYDGPNPWADFDENGSLTTRYLYGPAIDQLFARLATGEEPEWYLGDYLGSVRQIVKTDGMVLNEITYDSFGQILSETNPANGDRFKFTGREWDALFSQYYYRARYYGPDVGRFISEDPIGFAAGDPDLYRYVGNNPTSWSDPNGLQPQLPPPFDRDLYRRRELTLGGDRLVMDPPPPPPDPNGISWWNYWQPGAFFEGFSDGLHMFNEHATFGLIPYYREQARLARERGRGSRAYWWSDYCASVGANYYYMALGTRVMQGFGGPANTTAPNHLGPLSPAHRAAVNSANRIQVIRDGLAHDTAVYQRAIATGDQALAQRAARAIDAWNAELAVEQAWLDFLSSVFP